MNALLDLYAREPAMVLSGVGAVVTAVLVLLVSFGIPITMDEKAAINALVVVVITVGMGFLIRSRVSPVASLTPAPIQPPAA